MNDLLRQFVETRSADAFRQIVDAHIDAVHSQAMRSLHNSALAEEATQAVFMTLAQKGSGLSSNVVLEGWLFKTTRFCCSNLQRSESRRRVRERKAAHMRQESVEAVEDASDIQIAWTKAQPMLDDALAGLAERDRNVVLMRFIQGRTMRDVGATMGVSEDAAKQRVFRALEKLRSYFARRGVAVESTTLAGALGLAITPVSASVKDFVTQSAISQIVTGVPVSSSFFAKLYTGLFPKVAAGVIIASAVTAGIAIDSVSSPPPPILITQATPALQPSVTAPVVARSAPVEGLATLLNAMKTHDLKTVEQSLTADAPESLRAKAAKSNFLQESTTWRLRQAWKAKWGTDMQVPGFNFDWFPGGGGMIELLNELLKQPNLDVKNIDDTTAHVRVSLPPERFTGTGANKVEAFGRWSGAMLVMNKVDGQWKLNTDRTINVLIFLGRRDPNDQTDSYAIEIQGSDELKSGFADLALAIEQNRVTSKQDAIKIVESTCRAAIEAVNLNGANTMFLPVIGG